MKRPCAIMAWDYAARHCGSLDRAATLEDEKHIPPGHIVSRQTPVGKDGFETHNVFVEALGALHVIGVDRGLEDAVEVNHVLLLAIGVAGRDCALAASLTRGLK